MPASPSLWLYRLLLRSTLPAAGAWLWLEARRKGKRRPAVRERLGFRLPPIAPGGLWLQAVSVGEVEVARRLIAELGRCAAAVPVLLSSTTATGLALARRTLSQRLPVMAFPLDLTRPLARVLDAARPRAVALVETELWPELLHQCCRRSVPVAVVNARLSERAFARYLRVRRLMASLLSPLCLVAARSEADAERFAALGVPAQRIRVTGNVKFDLQPDPEPLPWEGVVRGWAGERAIVVAGSTMEGEEELLLAALERLEGAERPFVVLAPRHPERSGAVGRLLDQHGVRWAARSRFEQAPPAADLLLVDTIGELGRSYRLAAVAFVGGSLVATGGHNPLEPAVWGVPVLSGPHVFNFREVYERMVAAGAVRIVDGAEALADGLATWLRDREAGAAAGRAGRELVERSRGATARTVAELLALGGLAPAGA